VSRALVTGGAGFIGSHLVEGLLAAGWSVRVLDNFATGREANLAAVSNQIELACGDVREARVVEQAVCNVEVVFHLAAVASVPASVADPIETESVNVKGTLRVLEEARTAGARRVVLASSCAVYGEDAPLPVQESAAPDPTSPYAAQKAASEMYLRIYHRLHGLETVVLRYFNIYGPRQNPDGDYAAAIPRFVRACVDGEAPRIFGDGEQTRDFVFVADAVRANLLAASAAGAAGGTFNVASGVETTVNELVGTIARITGFPGQAHYSSARAGDIPRSVADPELARRGLGFEVEVGLEEGLTGTIAGYRVERGKAGESAA
jgi:UDP-glucose 4-epimerase